MDDIVFNHLAKDYGNGQGIFDITFSIKKGETFGYIGTNGSGKTTTIRSAMGFICPDKGNVEIRGMDSWKNASEIKNIISYIPGEIAFPDLNSGTEFLKNQAEFINIEEKEIIEKVVKRLRLDTSANLKRMSKGMKQKTAIVASFMKDADILIFDEPTTGLDPLMRKEFLSMVKEEKEKGKTIFMSSQSFEELQETCDRVALILNGKIVDIADINQLTSTDYKNFKIEFTNEDDYKRFKQTDYTITRDQEKYSQVTVVVRKDNLQKMFVDLKEYKVKFITEVGFSLERYFKAKLNEIKENKKEDKNV